MTAARTHQARHRALSPEDLAAAWDCGRSSPRAPVQDEEQIIRMIAPPVLAYEAARDGPAEGLAIAG